ncbi:MAG: DUF2970 domain-containing protein [Piscinibacter sp.]|nr:DUF2970 domain-containing protein [Piscinibacter sp.]
MDDRPSERWAWLQYAQAVLWSFFGIRRGNRARLDATAPPGSAHRHGVVSRGCLRDIAAVHCIRGL